MGHPGPAQLKPLFSVTSWAIDWMTVLESKNIGNKDGDRRRIKIRKTASEASVKTSKGESMNRKEPCGSFFNRAFRRGLLFAA